MDRAQMRQVAVDAVLRACRLCQSVQTALVDADTLAKKDKSPVTIADYGSQAVVIAALHAAFPDIPFVGEEEAAALLAPEGAELRAKVVRHVSQVAPEMDERAVLTAIDRGSYAGGATGRHWTLDPIDGTKGFLRKEQYAVALALIEEGQVTLGVLGCPNLPRDPFSVDGPKGCIFIADRGKGSTMRTLNDPAEIVTAVSLVEDPADASFCESVEAEHSAHDVSAVVAQKLGVVAAPVRMDSQCKYAAVARGEASIYLRMPTRPGYEEKIWDHAAGWLVVKESGGEVTDLTGKPLDFSIGRTLKNNQGVVATNGRLHQRVLDAIAAARGA